MTLPPVRKRAAPAVAWRASRSGTRSASPPSSTTSRRSSPSAAPGGGWSCRARAFVTDDTQMTLAVGTGCARRWSRRVPPRRTSLVPVREEFVAWYRSPGQQPGPGHTCLRRLRPLDRADRPWQEASQIRLQGLRRQHAGRARRPRPRAATDEQRAGAAQLQSALTHGHPTALAASDLTAHAVRLLAQGADPAGLPARCATTRREQRTTYHERWLGDLWTHAQDHGPEHFIAPRLGRVPRRPGPARGGAGGTDRRRPTRAGPPAPAGSPRRPWRPACCASCSSRTSPSPRSRRAACTSGDSDSIACLTGAFAGAHHGLAAWPEAWLERLEHRAELLAFGALWDGDGG